MRSTSSKKILITVDATEHNGQQEEAKDLHLVPAKLVMVRQDRIEDHSILLAHGNWRVSEQLYCFKVCYLGTGSCVSPLRVSLIKRVWCAGDWRL